MMSNILNKRQRKKNSIIERGIKAMKKVMMVPYYIWIILFIIVPFLLIVLFAFTTKTGDFTFENIISVGKYSNVFLKSILLGGIATLASLIISYPFACVISKQSKNVQNFLIMLIMIPMWMNFLLRTYAWMTILENNGLINNFLAFLGFDRVDLINTSGAVVLGMVYNFIPYMILPLHSSISKIDKRIIESAEDLGAGRVKVFSKVLIPLSIPGIMSGVTMVFVPSVSTFIISKMLGGGANLLIGDIIDMQFLGNSYNPHLGSAISLVLMFLILICMKTMNKFDNEEIMPMGR